MLGLWVAIAWKYCLTYCKRDGRSTQQINKKREEREKVGMNFEGLKTKRSAIKRFFCFALCNVVDSTREHTCTQAQTYKTSSGRLVLVRWGQIEGKRQRTLSLAHTETLIHTDEQPVYTELISTAVHTIFFSVDISLFFSLLSSFFFPL